MDDKVFVRRVVVLTTYQTLESDYRRQVNLTKVTCEWCGRLFQKSKLFYHQKYFCGPDAQRTEKQMKSQRKADYKEQKSCFVDFDLFRYFMMMIYWFNHHICVDNLLSLLNCKNVFTFILYSKWVDTMNNIFRCSQGFILFVQVCPLVLFCSRGWGCEDDEDWWNLNKYSPKSFECNPKCSNVSPARVS